MALAGVACANDFDVTRGGDTWYSNISGLTFVIEETDIIAAPTDGTEGAGVVLAAFGGSHYTQNNLGSNNFVLSEDNSGAITLTVGVGALQNLSGTEITSTTTYSWIDNPSRVKTFATTLSRGVEYTISGTGTNNDLTLTLSWDGDSEVLATYNGNVNGTDGDLTVIAKVNQNYSVPSIPEPATATLSLLALAGLCARRRRA